MKRPFPVNANAVLLDANAVRTAGDNVALIAILSPSAPLPVGKEIQSSRWVV